MHTSPQKFYCEQFTYDRISLRQMSNDDVDMWLIISIGVREVHFPFYETTHFNRFKPSILAMW